MKFKTHYILLVLVVLVQACKKTDVDITPSETSGGPSIYFKGEVNGSEVKFEAGENNYFQGHTWGAIGPPPQPLPVWGSHFSSSSSFDDGISFFMINQSTTVDVNRQSDMEKTIVKGDKNYTEAANILANEVFVSYRRNAFLYESALINQNGRKFTISNTKDTVFQDRKFIIATMEFDALLYSEFNKDTIEVKKGQARVAYLATKN
jgi:hypothetical protein